MEEKTIVQSETTGNMHTGRISQTFIYLGKLFRMFIFQTDWKVLPMSAVIAGLVSFAVGSNLFRTMEGTMTGTFAVSCICIWNGFFNSIQAVCRERAIVKREHRSGLHISSYVAAHMIYQAVLCMMQSIITLIILSITNVPLPTGAMFTGSAILEIWVTLFLVTFCADMLALMVSSIARNTTTAMTIMPFLLIFQLIFSGSYFSLPEEASALTDLTVSKWGLTALCSQGDYNSLPMVTIWNSIMKMKDVEYEGMKPVLLVMQEIDREGGREEFLLKTASYNTKPEFAHDPDVVLRCWGWLLFWTAVYVAITVLMLEMIDRDKR